MKFWNFSQKEVVCQFFCFGLDKNTFVYYTSRLMAVIPTKEEDQYGGGVEANQACNQDQKFQGD